VQPPRFEFYDPHSPIYTSPRFLPPAKIVKSKVSDAIISHGAYLEECIVENAIVGLRARLGKKTVIRVRHHVSLCTMPGMH
jgi:glucose-1-phosphate adenylyltransferase